MVAIAPTDVEMTITEETTGAIAPSRKSLLSLTASHRKSQSHAVSETFSKLYGREMKETQQILLFCAVFYLIMSAINVARLFNGGLAPSWQSMLPCSFQVPAVISELGRVTRAVDTARHMLGMVPAVILIVVLGRNMWRGVLGQPREFPFRLILGSWLWSTFVVLLIYSTVNVKVLTNYEPLVMTSCEVMVSQLFFPPVGKNTTSTASEQESTDFFRAVAAGYFANERNHMHAAEHPGLEAWLALIDQSQDRTVVDHSEGCIESDESSDSDVRIQVRPADDVAVVGYCNQGTAIATRDESAVPDEAEITNSFTLLSSPSSGSRSVTRPETGSVTGSATQCAGRIPS